MSQNYPNERRYSSMIFQAKNILEPKVIQAMYQVRKSIEEMVTPSGASWQEMCIKIPGNKDFCTYHFNVKTSWGK